MLYRFIVVLSVTAMLTMMPYTFVDKKTVAPLPVATSTEEIVHVEKPKPVAPSPARVSLREDLIPVCSCESSGSKNGTARQFNPDGTVVRGKINKNDVGICQINLVYHKAQAERLGLNLFTEEGNIQYANWLYDREGLTPWNWSKSCWQ